MALAPKIRKYTYAVKNFVLDDVGIPDTVPVSGFELIMSSGDDDVERSRADNWLPQIFRNVQAAYGRYSAQWPDLVWTWRYGGDWRAASARPPANGGTGTGVEKPGKAARWQT